MHELDHAFLHFDAPIPGPVGGAILQGWVVGKPGRHYTDVRIRAGGRLFPGVHGIPREDLAQFFKSSRRYLLAGFSVTMLLPAGRHSAELEALSLEGQQAVALAIVRREMGIMAVSCGVILFLGLRAAGTSGAF